MTPGILFDLLADRAVNGPDVIFPGATPPESGNAVLARGNLSDEIRSRPTEVCLAVHHGNQKTGIDPFCIPSPLHGGGSLDPLSPRRGPPNL
jgi:hypothetical protein